MTRPVLKLQRPKTTPFGGSSISVHLHLLAQPHLSLLLNDKSLFLQGRVYHYQFRPKRKLDINFSTMKSEKFN